MIVNYIILLWEVCLKGKHAKSFFEIKNEVLQNKEKDLELQHLYLFDPTIIMFVGG